jgi:hypothetical protein
MGTSRPCQSQYRRSLDTLGTRARPTGAIQTGLEIRQGADGEPLPKIKKGTRMKQSVSVELRAETGTGTGTKIDTAKSHVSDEEKESTAIQ